MSLSPGTRLGPYEIQELLGRGGMGEVYRAFDTRLNRAVAIKILPGALTADAESVRRFQNEARAVASLSHPNIVPLFDVGEQDGMRYAVAELVVGETLRVRLAGAPLPVPEAVEIAAQVAEGLTAAHEKGVVHRDIKPENIALMASGSPRILDFGLAKLSATAQPASDEGPTRSSLLTEPGVISGTVGYMSPEQVRGEALDGRSDLFSLGVVLYEMLTSRRPFQGSSQIETLNAILKEEPPPDPVLTALPPELERILRRCLAKRRENRYHSGADLAHDLRNSLTTTSSGATRATVPAEARRSRLPVIAAAVAGLAIVLAGVFLFGRRNTGSPSASGSPRTLAVLPFRAISAEGMPEHFGLGVADSVIGRLAAIRELTVRPTSAIARYETAPAEAASVGRTLGVDAVLEGTYQRIEGTTRVSVQMTNVSRGGILWSESIDLPEGRLFELQDAISRQVAEKLRVELAPSMRRTVGPSERVPDRVMEQFLAARARLLRVPTAVAEERQQIVASFDEIVEQAPSFARAIGARAYARAWLSFLRPSPETWSAAIADADRALALDPELAEPHLARASVAWSSLGGWDVVRAVRELKQAVAISPNLDSAQFDLARIYQHNGWLAEFEEALRAGERINPSAFEAERQRATLDAYGGVDRPRALERYTQLPAEAQRLWATRWPKDWLRALLEDPKRLEPEIEAQRRETPEEMRSAYSAILAILRAREGKDFADLEAEALAADHRMGHVHHVYHFLAEAHAMRGDLGESAGFLRRAAESGMPCGSCFDQDPVLKPLRGSPDYAAVRREIDRRNADYRAALKDVL